MQADAPASSIRLASTSASTNTRLMMFFPLSLFWSPFLRVMPLRFHHPALRWLDQEARTIGPVARNGEVSRTMQSASREPKASQSSVVDVLVGDGDTEAFVEA